MKKFKIEYKCGLKAPCVVEAADVESAIAIGLEQYRRGYGSAEMVHDWPADRVVESAVQVDAL